MNKESSQLDSGRVRLTRRIESVDKNYRRKKHWDDYQEKDIPNVIDPSANFITKRFDTTPFAQEKYDNRVEVYEWICKIFDEFAMAVRKDFKAFDFNHSPVKILGGEKTRNNGMPVNFYNRFRKESTKLKCITTLKGTGQHIGDNGLRLQKVPRDPNMSYAEAKRLSNMKGANRDDYLKEIKRPAVVPSTTRKNFSNPERMLQVMGYINSEKEFGQVDEIVFSLEAKDFTNKSLCFELKILLVYKPTFVEGIREFEEEDSDTREKHSLFARWQEKGGSTALAEEKIDCDFLDPVDKIISTFQSYWNNNIEDYEELTKKGPYSPPIEMTKEEQEQIDSNYKKIMEERHRIDEEEEKKREKEREEKKYIKNPSLRKKREKEIEMEKEKAKEREIDLSDVQIDDL